MGDAGRLRQVLVNLLGNAVKFTDHGRVWLVVDGGKTEDGRWALRFEVRDDGPGIPADQLESIFDPFTQVDGSSRRKQGGAGLGLTISAKIVERMGGTVRVESAPGQGSRFIVELPFEEAPGDGCKRVASFAPREAARAKRILVAEDNLVNQTLAKRMIEKLGHSVVLASDGLRALELATREPFDLIFMDVQMPTMDGYEAARLIRATVPGQVPIVAMTAHAMAGDRENCLAAGMTDYVSKPITFESLAGAIDRACEVTADEVPSAAQTGVRS